MGKQLFRTWEFPRSGSKAKNGENEKKIFVCIYLLVMPKYWGKQIFTHGRFPEVGQKQKTERKKDEEEERKTER